MALQETLNLSVHKSTKSPLQRGHKGELAPCPLLGRGLAGLVFLPDTSSQVPTGGEGDYFLQLRKHPLPPDTSQEQSLRKGARDGGAANSPTKGRGDRDTGRENEGDSQPIAFTGTALKGKGPWS